MTSTELDVARPSTGLAIAPASSMAAHLQDHLAALHAAEQIAELIHKTVRAYDGGYDEKGKQRAGKKEATVAIYHGQLIGLDPIQSLQNIIVVHGTPSMYARTMKALLLRAGHQVQTVESNDRRAVVRAKHRAAAEWEESTWTIERAQKAGYTSNPKYRSTPEDMLYARALAEACRRAAPDVLLGLAYSAEELETDPKPVRATSERIHVAEVLDQDEADPRTGLGVPVQQWQGPATAPASDSRAKPEAPQAEGLAEQPAAKRKTRTKAAPAVTKEQLERAKALLDELRIPQEDMRATVSELLGFDSELDDVRRLTKVQGDELIAALTAKVTGRATPDQITALEGALILEGLDTDEARLDWVRTSVRNPDLQSLAELLGSQADEMTEFLTAAQAADARDRAAEGQQALDTEGGPQ